MSAPTLADFDWVQTRSGEQLHAVHMHIPIGKLARLDDALPTFVRLACGRRTVASIPGPFTRIRAKRCDRCCDALGYPRGVGSPKNDRSESVV